MDRSTGEKPVMVMLYGMLLAQSPNGPFSDTSSINTIIGILLIVFTVALLIPGILATAGKLPGNGVIGLRVPEVRKHESTWRQAHRVTGPFWVLAAVAFAIGAAFAFIAYGWMWILVAVAVIAGFVSISVGGNFGARAAALVDAALDASDSDSSDEPAVDLGALRKAAGKADEQQ